MKNLIIVLLVFVSSLLYSQTDTVYMELNVDPIDHNGIFQTTNACVIENTLVVIKTIFLIKVKEDTVYNGNRFKKL